MRIVVTVTARFEADQSETMAGDPVVEQSYTRIELDPSAWSGVVDSLGRAAVHDVTRMIGALVVPPSPPPEAPITQAML